MDAMMGAHKERIVQLVPWRDLLLALTTHGRVFRMIPEHDAGGFIFALACSGLPQMREGE